MADALIKINRIIPNNRFISYKDLMSLSNSSDIVWKMYRNQSLFDIVTVSNYIAGTTTMSEAYLLDHDFFFQLKDFCNSWCTGFWTFRLFSGDAGNEIVSMDILVPNNRRWPYTVIVYMENEEDHKRFLSEFVLIKKLTD
jgi:hypothetical protein